MKLSDYLLNQDGIDWPDLLAPYKKLHGFGFTIWMVNLFGDLIIERASGFIEYFDSSSGCIRVLSNNKDEFFNWIEVSENSNDAFMIPLVDDCLISNKILGAKQCYSFRKPPVLGGSYDCSNVDVCDLSAHYYMMAQVVNQIEGIPDGTKITVTLRDA